MNKTVDLWTDGACKGNPGKGGWGFILIYKNHKKCLNGYEPETTNNRMELTAVIRGLQALKEPCDVVIYSDSAYVINSIQEGWVKKWERAGWRNGPNKKNDVINKDLWKQFLYFDEIHKISTHKVFGHRGIRLNEECDNLANRAILGDIIDESI